MAQPGTQTAGMMSYGRPRKTPPANKRLALTGKCETCGSTFKNRRMRQSKSKGEEIQSLKFCEK